MRKWSRFCVSYDFAKNQAQVAFNGKVSNLVENPKTMPNFFGTFDANIITNASVGTQMVVVVGRYSFDKNPWIGYMAGINAWNRTMSAEELAANTNCEDTSVLVGNLINEDSVWDMTGTLTKEMEVDPKDFLCNKETQKINAFLPIPELTRNDSVDLCQKLGRDVYIAGNFEDEADFDNYYEGMLSNSEYVFECGFHDNGRIKTWIPYRPNADHTYQVHDITGKGNVNTVVNDNVDFESIGLPLLPNNSDKFYVTWHPDPHPPPDLCGAGYFGLVPKYRNLHTDSCRNKKCTGCELHNSFSETLWITLRGLCKYSLFDTDYQVQYSGQNNLYYVGTERSIIRTVFISLPTKTF